MARPFHALLVQLAQQLRFRAAQRVPLQNRLRRFVVRAQKSLCLFAERLLKQRDQRRRMAVLCGEVGRLRQCILCAGQAPQHAVHQTRCTRIGIFFCLRHGLVDRRRVRHFIQKHDLIRAEPQNVQHHRLQILQLPAHEPAQIKIQKPPVLLHAVAQPRGQRGIPPVKPVAPRIFLQGPVRKRALPPAGDQNRQCRRSCSHDTLRSRSDGRGNSQQPPFFFRPRPAIPAQRAQSHRRMRPPSPALSPQGVSPALCPSSAPSARHGRP